MARMWLRAMKLRTPVHGSRTTRARSSIPNVSGSVFISHCLVTRASYRERADLEVARHRAHLVGEAGEVDVHREAHRLIERAEEVVVVGRHHDARLEAPEDAIEVARREAAPRDAAQEDVDAAVADGVIDEI